MTPTRTQQVNLEREAQACKLLLDGIGSAFVGKRPVVRKMLAGALAGGHVLFEDNPGLGKTLLVKAFARIIGAEHRRVQFTPDILPADILGTKVWDPEARQFRLMKGPVHTHLLLADEINRAPPRTQSALLESMEERQVSIDGETMPLPTPFFVLATQNPIEQEGTYPLPEAQMDRFLFRLHTGYPDSVELEGEILARRLGWRKDDPTNDLKPIVNIQQFRALQLAVENSVFVHDEIILYIARVVRSMREHPMVEVGPSPRGSLALLKGARALALIHGRDYVIPDDVKAIAADALAHRTLLKMEHVLDGASGAKVVGEVLAGIAAPTRFKAGA